MKYIITRESDKDADFELLLDLAQSIARQHPWVDYPIEVDMGGTHCAYCGQSGWFRHHKDDCRWELAKALVDKYRPKKQNAVVTKKCLICKKNVNVQRNEDNTGWIITNVDGTEHRHPRSRRPFDWEWEEDEREY